jgi:YVTN family beta-propeller protein
MLTRLAGVLVVLVLLTGSPEIGAAAPKAYVGLFKDNAVAVVDTASDRVTGTIPVPPGPHGLVVTPDGRKVYVSSDGASTVSVIDTASDRVVGSIEVGASPHGLAMSRDGRRVLVSGFGTSQALIVDTATDRVIARIPVPQPHNAAISPDGHMAYVASQAEGATALVAVDLDRQTVVARVPLDQPPRALDWSPDGTRVYFTVAGVPALQVLDPAARRIVGRIPVGASPHFAPFTADGRLALVVAQGPAELQLVEVLAGARSGEVGVGQAPHWVAATSDARTAYVTNEGSNDVSVIDLESRRVRATIAVGNAPRKVVVQPGPSARAAGPAVAPVPAHAAAAMGQPLRLGSTTFADHGTADVRGLARVEIEVDDYYFAPTFLRGHPGQRLTLVVENESATLHSVTIPVLHVDRDVPPKGKVELAVTFPASGVVHLFCKFHEALGMNGELLAGDAAPQPVASRP